MIQAITILSKQIKMHQDEIVRLSNIEPKSDAEEIFIDFDVINHQTQIEHLQAAILKLSK